MNHRQTIQTIARRLPHLQRHDVVEDALAPLRSVTLNLLSEKWQRGTIVDVIYLSGGGAELVYDAVAEAYPQTQLVPNAQIANAYGYLKYARFAERV